MAESEPITRIMRPALGDVPGALVRHDAAQPTRLRITDFTPTALEVRDNAQVSDLPRFISRDSVTWLDVQGFADHDAIRGLAQTLELHPLMLADAINVPQRAKAEQYPDYLFIVLHAPRSCDEALITEQVSVVFNEKFVLSFQEQADTDTFAAVSARIGHNRGIVRARGTAYLAYALLDVVTDHYFPILDQLEARLERLETRLLRGDLEVLEEAYDLRHLCVALDRAIRGNCDALNTLLNLPGGMIPDDVRTYLRDCLDHAIRQEHQAQELYDFAMSLRELHAASQTARMNEIIKVLTMVSTVFIPLSFFAGVYGMNFDTGAGNMPELGWRGAYWMWWAVMLALVAGMLWFFRARGWIGRRKRARYRRRR